MLDWIFEGIITWVSSVVTDLMDAVSGLFLQALGTDMTAMEEYFPFVTKAFTVMQYTAWAILFLITVWQLFRIFGGPMTDAENPWTLIARSALMALLIGYAKPIFSMVLDIARAPYTALMDIQLSAEDFTFAGIEAMLMNGLTTLIATISVVGLLLLVILELCLGWNYFKLLLETVERYTVNVHNDKITIEEPPKTGDNSNMGLWFGLLMLSCLGMVGTVIYGRRRRRKDAEV